MIKTIFYIFLILLLAGFLFIQFRMFSSGHVNWGDDFALYLQHAKNIAQNRLYTQSGYIYNMLHTTIGPRNYPPGYPIFLSFFIDESVKYFIYAKAANMLLFFIGIIGWAALLAKLFSSKLSAILASLFVLVEPNLFAMRGWIIADHMVFTFLPLSLLSLILVMEKASYRRLWITVASLSIVALAISHIIGLIITFGMAVIFYIGNYKKYSIAIFLVSILSVVLLFVLGILGSYSQQIDYHYFFRLLSILTINIEYYNQQIASLFLLPVSEHFLSIPFLGILFVFIKISSTPFFVIGMVFLFFRFYSQKISIINKTVINIHYKQVISILFLYIIIILFWELHQGLRYLYPVMPFIIGLIFLGLILIVRHLKKGFLLNLGRVAAGIFVITIFFFQIINIRHYLTIKEHDVFSEPSVKELLNYVSAFPDNERYLFEKPRALALLTQKAAGAPAGNPEQIVRFMEENKISSIIDAKSPKDPNSNAILAKLFDKYPERFKTIWENSRFIIYEYNVPIQTENRFETIP